eukprot:TRINITY_DN12840_c0_g1_i1.p1 TRINITY_DN12840_c0_g1~~TRINITY_DN12840_c0_g1_i1.p1  ORF type:complete len:478 (-),score=104.94 TRINITY_DN12840_c0_g1_i1:77-1510(-)
MYPRGGCAAAMRPRGAYAPSPGAASGCAALYPAALAVAACDPWYHHLGKGSASLPDAEAFAPGLASEAVYRLAALELERRAEQDRDDGALRAAMEGTPRGARARQELNPGAEYRFAAGSRLVSAQVWELERFADELRDDNALKTAMGSSPTSARLRLASSSPLSARGRSGSPLRRLGNIDSRGGKATAGAPASSAVRSESGQVASCICVPRKTTAQDSAPGGAVRAAYGSIAALEREVQRGDLFGIECCAKAGADLNALFPSGGGPALVSAAGSGNVEAVRRLLMLRANANARNAAGLSALMVASAAGQELVVDALLCDLTPEATAAALAATSGRGSGGATAAGLVERCLTAARAAECVARDDVAAGERRLLSGAAPSSSLSRPQLSQPLAAEAPAVLAVPGDMQEAEARADALERVAQRLHAAAAGKGADVAAPAVAAVVDSGKPELPPAADAKAEVAVAPSVRGPGRWWLRAVMP